MDDKTRNDLGIVTGREYEFEIENVSRWRKIKWALDSSDQALRITVWIALISLLLGVLSLGLGVLSFVMALLSTPFHKFVHVFLMRRSSLASGAPVWRANGPSRAA